LADRPRVTSELHTCPSCSAAVQPGWGFCKSCGERLRGAIGEQAIVACPKCGAPADPSALNCIRCGHDLTGRDAPAAPDSADTSVIAACPSCGERLDKGSLYCKGCGSAVYIEQMPFGGSSMLCGACNGHSPLGSRVCRVCGAPFVQGSRTVAEFPAAATTVAQKIPTLPGLDDRLSGQSPAGTTESHGESDFEANTAIFSGNARDAKGTVETSMLPGTAGSRSEQQAPTAVMQMGRTTGPVEEQAEELPPSSIPSGELRPSSSLGSVVEGTAIIGEAAADFTNEPKRPTTADFGSDSDSTAPHSSSENKTAIFVSPTLSTPPAPSGELPQKDMGTRKFAPPPPSIESEPTREFQPVPNAPAAESNPVTGPVTNASQWTAAAPSQPIAVTEATQPEWQNQPEAQVVAPPVVAPPVPKKGNGLAIAVVVGVLILLGAAAAVAWLVFGGKKPTPRVTPPVVVEQPVTPEPPITTPVKPPAPVVPEGMVAVAAGTYSIGKDGADADPLERPAHKVDLPAFFIDRTEVTNAAYKNFVDTTGHKAPSNWTAGSFPQGLDAFPVTGVTWQDAADYAAWAGKRLPSEAEWEAAARGADGRIYPWGNAFRSGVANIKAKPDKPTAEQYPTGIKETGRFAEGASPTGAMDMIGNAWEWVADEIKVYPGNTESKLELEPGSTYRVIRGGAYDGSEVNDATYRGYLEATRPYPKVGFRCVKDAK